MSEMTRQSPAVLSEGIFPTY